MVKAGVPCQAAPSPEPCSRAALPEQCHPAVGLHKWCSHTVIIPHQLFTYLSASCSIQALSYQLYLGQKYSLNPTFGVTFCLSSPSFLRAVVVPRCVALLFLLCASGLLPCPPGCADVWPCLCVHRKVALCSTFVWLPVLTVTCLDYLPNPFCSCFFSASLNNWPSQSAWAALLHVIPRQCSCLGTSTGYSIKLGSVPKTFQFSCACSGIHQNPSL